jgi:hypothetical protein
MGCIRVPADAMTVINDLHILRSRYTPIRAGISNRRSDPPAVSRWLFTKPAMLSVVGGLPGSLLLRL